MIRISNIDYNVPGMRREDVLYLGDLTATLERTIFAAPMDCRILSIDIYSKQTNVFNTSQCLSITARLQPGSGCSLGVFNVAITANDRNRITPSANNSLTAGTMIELSISATCQTLSQVMVQVIYVPIKHRATR